MYVKDGKIMLLKSGMAVIWPSSVYDENEESFQQGPQIVIEGASVGVALGQVMIECNYEAVDHLVQYGQEILLYEDSGAPSLSYYGQLSLDRDALLEAKGVLNYLRSEPTKRPD